MQSITELATKNIVELATIYQASWTAMTDEAMSEDEAQKHFAMMCKLEAIFRRCAADLRRR